MAPNGEKKHYQSADDRDGTSISSRAQFLSDMATAARGLPMLGSIPMFCLSILVGISFIGTFTGMLRVLQSGDNSFGFFGFLGVFLFILATTIIMAYSVSQMVRSGIGLRNRLSLMLTYLITLVISMSFGFAFYWSQLEARSQSIEEAQRFLTAFNREVRLADEQLTATNETLVNLQVQFTERARLEALPGPSGGGQCGEDSKGGPGPRARHLAQRASDIDAIVQSLTPRIERIRTKSETVIEDIDAVNAIGDENAKDTSPEAREQVLRKAARSAEDAGVTLLALAEDKGIEDNVANFRTWATEYNDPTLERIEQGTGSRFRCENQTFGAMLNGVARDLESLPRLPIPELNSYAGAKATREALDRFFYTLFSPIRPFFGETRDAAQTQQIEAIRREAIAEVLQEAGEAPRADELSSREVKQLAVSSQGIRRNDSLPLGLAFVVDFLLFCASIWSKPNERFGAYARMMKDLRKVEDNPIEMVSGAKELEADENYQFLQPYLFRLGREMFVAVPSNLGAEADAADRVVNNLMIGWTEGGLVLPSFVLTKTIKQRLGRAGSAKAAMDGNFDAYRFRRNAFESLILKGLLDLEALRLDEDGDE